MARHSALSIAFMLHSAAESPVQSLTSFIHDRGGRPLARFPSTFPSKTSLTTPSCRLVWPKNFNFLLLMVFNNVGRTSNKSHTSALVFLSLKLTFPIRRNVHISKAFILLSRSLFKVHVSHPYNTAECT